MPENFSYFTRLPAEIRFMIWEHSLPDPRVYEILDSPNSTLKSSPQQGLMYASGHAEPPPALSAVCSESRYFVLRHYKPLTLGAVTKYVDLSRDLLLLEPYLLVKRLHRTMHFMSRIPLIRDNISELALGTSFGSYIGISHPVLSWKAVGNSANVGKLLSDLAKFPRLKSLIFILHQEFQVQIDLSTPGTLTNSMLSAPTEPGRSFVLVPTNAPVTISNNTSTSTHSLSLLPPPPPLQLMLSSTPPPPPATLLPRPQLIYQPRQFLPDVKANINNSPPRQPHVNELLYYPLEVDEDDDDGWGDAPGLGGGEWFEPWPTNDDWRRFRRRFIRAVKTSLEMDMVATPPLPPSLSSSPPSIWDTKTKGRKRKRCATSGGPSGRGTGAEGGEGGWGGFYKTEDDVGERRRVPLPALKGASLLWRYVSR
ncbi:hypothetical protein VTK73DRAFT_8713 [Phialemonium thermophilum]|uniref:2EXR domain-containing protein n=1 Tax=Phialemonium thermophilum TaxID=223376 RepID=A0ABR3XNJ8_9PEZI